MILLPAGAMEHVAVLQAFVDASVAAGVQVTMADATKLHQSLAHIPGLDASKAMVVMTYALPHAPSGALFGDAEALAQALIDIEGREGSEVAAQCQTALRVLLETLPGPHRSSERESSAPS